MLVGCYIRGSTKLSKSSGYHSDLPAFVGDVNGRIQVKIISFGVG